MNLFVVSPDWHWWIVFYFFLGGIAAGTYFLATLIEMFGQEEDQALARLGFRLSLPLISICGIFLIADLERPDRFWHMLFQSEVVHEARAEGWPGGGWDTIRYAPLLKWWSPMSIGAWALTLFGAWSFFSFVTTFWNPRAFALFHGRNWFGHGFHLIGSGLGFFIAAYAGVLLSATNQPLWTNTDWIAPLFLTSAASTSISLLLLLGRGISADTRERLEKADLWALGLELFIFLIFLASLGNLLPFVLGTVEGIILVVGTLLVGLLLPLGLHLAYDRANPTRVTAAAVSALIGGFLLRYGIVMVAPALLDVFPHDDPQGLANQLDDIVNAPLYRGWQGMVLIALTVGLACAIPLLLRKHWHLAVRQTALACAVSALVVVSVLFYSVQPLANRAGVTLVRSPEDQRHPGGGVGASGLNRPDVVRMHTKFNEGE